MINYNLYESDASAKDGGFVFQAIVSHVVKWEIVNGETKIDPKTINTTLHRVDIFPDIKFTEGSATASYIILSEVNILKRKFELASEAIKKRINPEYANEINQFLKSGSSDTSRSDINLKHFKNTYFEVKLMTDQLVLREVSTSGINTGSPSIALKLSTGMVDTMDGQPIKTWDKFKIKVDGSSTLEILNSTEAISGITEYDEIENANDIVFRTILPSLILEFKGDRVSIDTYSNRSTQTIARTALDYSDIFSVKDTTKEAPVKSDTSK